MDYTLEFPGCPFRFFINRTKASVPNAGDVQFCTIERIENNVLVGSFVFGYHCNLENIIKPFMLGGDWYMTYATSHTKISVAKLTSQIEHIDSDAGGAGGFCPIEVAIPYMLTYDDMDGDLRTYYSWNYPDPKHGYDVSFAPFAFLSGCEWGDDRVPKLRYIDLSKLVSDRKINVYAPFNYFHLPPTGRLSAHVDVDDLFDDMLFVNRCEMFVRRADGTWRDETTRSEQQPRAKLLRSLADAQHKRKWLYESNKELNGMTPDDATCTLDGTVRAIELLFKEFPDGSTCD